MKKMHNTIKYSQYKVTLMYMVVLSPMSMKNSSDPIGNQNRDLAA